MLTAAFVCLLMQQVDQSALDKAMAADAAEAAAKSSASPTPAGAAASTEAAPPNATPAVPPPAMDASPTAAAPAGWQAQQSVRTPGGSLLNPALSVILDSAFGYYGVRAGTFGALGLPVAGDDPTPAREGFSVQEVEVAAQAAIDPYLEGAVFLTIPNLDGVEVEEGYLVTTSLPLNLQIKAGTFRSQIGRNNTQHLHMQSFTRRPLMTALLFGPDGLRGPGAQASVLLPVPWFATLYGEAFSIGPPDDLAGVATFGGGARLSPPNLTYTAVLEQFFELAESHSLLLGLNFATGRAIDCATGAPCTTTDPEGTRSRLYGADLYYKWKPANVARTYASFQLTNEYFVRTLAGGPTEAAGYSEAVLQFARRFYFGCRFDVTGLPSGPNLPRRYAYALSLTFAPSEFSRIRLYAQELDGPRVAAASVGFIQAEYSIGAHGAHPF